MSVQDEWSLVVSYSVSIREQVSRVSNCAEKYLPGSKRLCKHFVLPNTIPIILFEFSYSKHWALQAIYSALSSFLHP